MDLLTVKEVAELKGCSLQYIKRIIKEGKLQAEETINKQNNKKQYVIPVSALPEELQIKYYNKTKKDEPSLPSPKTMIKQRKNTVLKSYESYSEEERKRINFWSGVIEDWQAGRTYRDNKTKYDHDYIGKLRIENPDIDISVPTLYRKYAAYKEKDWDGLIGKRGGYNKGQNSIPEEVWQGFLDIYLDDHQYKVAKCYESTLEWTAQWYPQYVDCFPSVQTFRYHIKKDIGEAIKILMRKGEKAFYDRCLPYVGRLYDKLEVNECWIADNHTLDVMSVNGDGKPHRLYITAFMDAKSGIITGYNITETVCSASTILALRNGIEKFGIPQSVYFDNGTEFLVHDIGGRGHRTKKGAEIDPPTILQRLGIEMHNALVRNARAKPIERLFGTLKDQFSRSMTGFCGGTILERPETLKRRIKNGDLPTDLELRSALDSWINYDYNMQEYGGVEIKYKGLSRLDVWNDEIKSVRMASESELNLMLMRSTQTQKIKRDGVYVTIFGEKIWYYNTAETIENLGKEVYVRYDPAKLSSVRIYDTDDRYLYTWNCADALMLEYLEQDQQKIANAEQIINSARRHVKQIAKGLTDGLTAEQRITNLDMSLRRQNRNKDYYKIEMPTKIIPVRADEKNEEIAHAVGEVESVTIDLSKMINNAKKRKD